MTRTCIRRRLLCLLCRNRRASAPVLRRVCSADAACGTAAAAARMQAIRKDAQRGPSCVMVAAGALQARYHVRAAREARRKEDDVTCERGSGLGRRHCAALWQVAAKQHCLLKATAGQRLLRPVAQIGIQRRQGGLEDAPAIQICVARRSCVPAPRRDQLPCFLFRTCGLRLPS